MARRALLLILVLLVTLAVTARVRTGWSRLQRGTAAGPSKQSPDLTLPTARDHRTRAALDLPGGPITPLDSTARLTVRLELGAELERHYLDSLIVGTDSVIRHWPLGDAPLRYCIVPGGSPGFQPEMMHDVRWAITEWNPTSAGIRLREVSDTDDADMIVRWTDTLDGERAGITDVTWDRGGRIRRAEISLATRSTTTGRPYSPEVRRAVALHEMGHALGLPHSSQPGDAMYPVAAVTTTSARDRFSLQLLYRLPTGWVGAGRLPGPGAHR